MTQVEALVESIKGLRETLNAQAGELSHLRQAAIAMAQAGAALEQRVGALEQARPRIVIPGGGC